MILKHDPTPLQLELGKIDAQIVALQRRRRAVLTAEHPTVPKLRESVLLPVEKVTRKNRLKLEVMGRVRFALLRHPHGKDGLTSAQIFELVRRGTDQFGFDTLRSYLSRFKKEGRLVHVEQHNLWKLKAGERDSVENN